MRTLTGRWSEPQAQIDEAVTGARLWLKMNETTWLARTPIYRYISILVIHAGLRKKDDDDQTQVDEDN